MRIWFYGCLMLCLTCCENKIDSLPTNSLEFIQTTLSIGDSVSFKLLNGDKIESIKAIPNVGRFSNSYFIAPNSIGTENLTVQVTAQSNGRNYSKTLLITKGGKPDHIILYKTMIQPVLTNNCNFTACHGNGSRAGKVELSSWDSAIKHVQPYQPLESILFLSLIKTDPLRRMPPAGPLNNNQIQLISNWIEQGALNN